MRQRGTAILLAALVGSGCGEAGVDETPAVEASDEAEVEASDEAQHDETQQREAPTDFIDVDAASLHDALRAHPGRVLLVNVWSTWCEPCVDEMPALIATAREYEDRGLALVLIATEAPSNREAAFRFLDDAGAPPRRYFKTGSDDAFITALHDEWSGALPATFLLDRARGVRHFWPEPVTPDELRGPIEAALGNEESP